MSYGKWKAMQPVVPIEPKKEVIPDDWVKCGYCGKAFPPRTGKKYCNGECRKMAWDRSDHKKAYMKQWKAKRKECAEHGK